MPISCNKKRQKNWALHPDLVGVASTGVIGEMMHMEPIVKGIQKLEPSTKLEGSILFSQAILTTDTVTKNTAYSTMIDGKEITIAGTAKGSGMIEPNMATMLGFITTDAKIESIHLQAALKSVTDLTFNSITVDGDTSTNDMVLVMANGMADNNTLTPAHPDWEQFYQSFTCCIPRSCENDCERTEKARRSLLKSK